jgi:hypothetical protein
LQAQNSHIPSSLTHFTHTQNTDHCNLKNSQIPTTLTNTHPYCNFKNSDIPSSKNTTHIIPNLNFTDSKLSNKHTHTHTQTHRNLLLQAQISQISGDFYAKKTHNFCCNLQNGEWVVGFLLDNAKFPNKFRR